MKLLLHTCCAPCLTFPLRFLKEKNIDFTTYFFNPNIHPFREFKKRKNCLVEFVQNHKIPAFFDHEYGLVDFTRRVVFNEEKRCSICYEFRLEHSLIFAKKNNFTSFSTTLLYSRYQNHSLIVEICKALSERYELDFFYHDFRKGWQNGIETAIKEELYRQSYCGCIYSEQERYDNRLKKRLHKKRG